jgi:hypothetical protein
MKCANLRYTSGSIAPLTLTNIGLQIRLPLVSVYHPNDDITSQSGGGWIGLLSCSSSTSQAFLGIPLVPDLDDDVHGVTKLTRVQILKGMSCSVDPTVTLAVGAKAAVRSNLGTITISRYGLNAFGPHDSTGHLQIIVNESKKLHEMGYRVRNGPKLIITHRGWDGQQMLDNDPIWDSKALTLTMEYAWAYEVMIEFCFERPWGKQNSRFTIFMHTRSRGATVRKGHTFSKDEKRDLRHYLNNQSTQDDTDSIMIQSRKGRMFKVKARIQEIKVYHHRLFEVIIEADQVATTLSKPLKL